MISLKKTETSSDKKVDWGIRAKDWAELQEPLSIPLYASILSNIQMNAMPMSLLDIGCGSAVLCKMAYNKGFKVTGLDSARGMLEEAEKRMPQGSFYEADMEALPFEDETFDVVTGVTSFHIASDQAKAIREAARVLKKGGQFFHAIWGPPQENGTSAMLGALKHIMPPPKGPSPTGPLWEEGKLEKFLSDNGLKPEGRYKERFSWDYKDEEHVLRANLAAVMSWKEIGEWGEENTRKALSESLQPFRKEDGSYSITNTFIYVKAVK